MLWCMAKITLSPTEDLLLLPAGSVGCWWLLAVSLVKPCLNWKVLPHFRAYPIARDSPHPVAGGGGQWRIEGSNPRVLLSVQDILKDHPGSDATHCWGRLRALLWLSGCSVSPVFSPAFHAPLHVLFQEHSPKSLLHAPLNVSVHEMQPKGPTCSPFCCLAWW